MDERLRVGDVFRTAASGTRVALGPFLVLAALLIAWGWVAPRPAFEPDAPLDVSAGLTWALSSLVFFTIYSVLYIGLACIALDACRGRPVEWRRLWPSMSLLTEIGVVLLVAWLAAWLGPVVVVLVLLTSVGSLAKSPVMLVLASQIAFWPIVVLSLGWSQVYNCVIDGTSRWLSSMTDSWRLTRGHKLQLFVVYATLFVVAAGVLLPLELYMHGMLDLIRSGAEISAEQLRSWNEGSSSAGGMALSAVGSAFNLFVVFVHAALYVRLRSIEHAADGATDAFG